MVFSDADAAALYDLLNPWDPARYPGDAFYHELVMAADAVLDVGCGTGSMLHRARVWAPWPARRANLKGVELANLCRDTIAEVLEAAWQGIGRVRHERGLLFSFLRHCGLEL